MLPFGVTIPATVPQGSEIPEGLMNNPVFHVEYLPFFFQNCAVYEIMWENTVEGDRLQMTIWPTRIACWMPKTTN
jgi:hypothetical protein